MNIRAIFDGALDITDPVQRSEYLDEACGDNPELRRQVEELLGARQQLGSFLEHPPVEAAATELLGGATNGLGLGAPEEPPLSHSDDIRLDFLEPPTRDGTLGRLGHYEVLECLGCGAFGIVLKAFDESLQRIVAVKVLSPEMATTSPARKRFLREALAAAKVRHENVVQIYAVADQPLPYLVMEFIPGETLQQRLDRTGPLELPDVLRLGCQMARALAAAHSEGLIHRDIKPGNILLESGVEERVRITDFGLARAVDDASLTQSGYIAGTPMFMAPEQAHGEPIDPRTDLFSLGSVLYTMVSGRPPFRASTTIAVLKRVCDDTPRPIAEIIPETPAWLIAIIEKLQAKQPEDRFQSATEVAELLAAHLAHLQHPAVAPLPARVADHPPRRRPSRFGRRRQWLAAAGVLLALLGGLGLSDAAGVTHVAEFMATVLRIRTPDGTLFVQVDDPQVQVTIEGDGGIRITGAGPQEVRLRPGLYRVEASKDGQPVKDELVTIERGGRQVVRVSLESAAAQAGTIVLPATEQPFVVLGGVGVAERTFDTLAEAVVRAADGDTIEIRGNGPWSVRPNYLGNRNLHIRAADGFKPVIKLRREPGEEDLQLFWGEALLSLEGLEFQSESPPKTASGKAYFSATRFLYIANCKFFLPGFICSWSQEFSRKCFVTNSEFYQCAVLGGHGPPEGVWVVDNCVHGGENFLHANQSGSGLLDRQIEVRRCSVAGGYDLLVLPMVPAPRDSNESEATPLHVSVIASIVHNISLLDIHQSEVSLAGAAPLAPAEWEAYLHRLIEWRGEHNLLGVPEGRWLSFSFPPDAVLPSAPQDLASWRLYWNSAEARCVEGHPRFQGGDLAVRIRVEPDKVTPDDFRLRSDSPGYQAGPDGRDLGADIDLVGPGQAYERWKQTTAYQAWLKETGRSHD